MEPLVAAFEQVKSQAVTSGEASRIPETLLLLVFQNWPQPSAGGQTP